MLKRSRTGLDPQALAIGALSFIASDPERLGRFLSVTGIGPATLRSAAKEPEFLARILDYLGEDEALLLAFAANAGHAPEALAAARSALSGQAG